ncbi:MAG: TetR/AcrR family transcriptional regulator [Gordonia sp. (in: high G+C Gram-positive bacteria)]|uniref:TetR/AcrR family transcriptional regulator n=1 Tax=Gordonia sp. (in: high G+C Gram-positive bacteria) TaxID=84139 RepID=UPI003BB64A14
MNETTFARRRPRDFDGSSSAEQTVFAATEDLLGTVTLQDLTVAQIIGAAGVSRANFYHYFANKYDVVVALLGRVLEDSYSAAGPWTESPGRDRARQLGVSLDNTLSMWSEHGAVICAVLEHMHTKPAVAAAWQQVFNQFVDSLAEQITFMRSEDAAPAGPEAATLAAMLVGGTERAFYVAARGLDPNLVIGDLTEPLRAVNEAAIEGQRAGAFTTGPERTFAVGELTVPEVEGDTARTLLSAMAELLVDRTLADLSVTQLLEKAGVSRASFYFYFRSIEDAFVVLFREAAVEIVAGLAAALTDVVDGGPGDLRELISSWLVLDGNAAAVIRSAVHTWPRLPALRDEYLTAMGAMKTTLESSIELQRARGVIPDGPPTPGYAAVVLWTIERAVAGSLAGEEHVGDLDVVLDSVTRMLSAVLYNAPLPAE